MVDTLKLNEMDEEIEGKPCYIINPEARRMGIWDAITAVALVFTALVTPFEVGFLPPPETPSDWLFVVNRVLDSIFIIDMVISSLMMYRVPQRTLKKRENRALQRGSTLQADLATPETGRPWEFRLREILKNYLKGWFLIDLLSVVPSTFDILPFVSPLPTSVSTNGTESIEWGSGVPLENATDAAAQPPTRIAGVKVLRVIRTLRLIKLLRLLRGSRVLKRWETRISMPYATIALLQIMLMVVYAAALATATVPAAAAVAAAALPHVPADVFPPLPPPAGTPST
jgi:hypothetical protein